MIIDRDQFFLRRALRLAMNGRGVVEPNPMVGCVLVKNDTIIGEGWHLGFGKPHAEPTALADCKSQGNDPAGATAYVTLEPCCHTKKKTPPCAPKLIEAKITRVVIGCLDPNPDVDGNGVAMLRAAGIEVDMLPNASPLPLGEGQGEGLAGLSSSLSSPAPSKYQALTPALSQRERELNASHFKQLIAPFAQQDVAYGRTLYLTLKWAESGDGVVAGRNGARVQISNAASSRFVHQLRARSGAVMVGINTVINDDPLLNARDVPVERQPARIVLDRSLRIPSHSKLIQTANLPDYGRLILLCSKETYRSSPRVAELAPVAEVDALDDGELREALEVSAAWSGFVAHEQFLVEPGPTLARALLTSADRLIVCRSPLRIKGGPSAPRSASIPDYYVPTATLTLDGDTLTEYLNTRSPAFFAATPSADMVLAVDAADGIASTGPV
jgi:diaminohydroxyphosphoribosylaminopyrimidine deaminase / 5-amino-6-(5-phosphoribosylamino)uracil reductase